MSLPGRLPSVALGELERSVLEALWTASGPLSVREVHAALHRKPVLAYTTVLTVLDRLHEKGFVARQKDGRAFRYRAKFAREAYLGERAFAALSPKGDPPTEVLLAFLDSAGARDPALLDRLADLIAEKKRERS